MKALHFGAGNIGRGFIGKTLFESGFNIIFSDINQDIVNYINDYQKYLVKTVGINTCKTTYVKKVTAIHCSNPKIFETIRSVNLITTAVGVNALKNIASIISKGIILKIQKKCIKPLNIIACENKIEASSFLKKSVLEILPNEYHDYLNQYIGFVDCSIDTIIPISNDNQFNLSVIAEEFKEWVVNSNQFKGIIPKIIDMQLSTYLNPFIERKLFTLNTGHAIAAYLGLIKNYKTIKEAIQDQKIRIIVQNAMEESGLVLIKRFNFNKNYHFNYIKKIFLRFENNFLSDSLERIARNPLQKLGIEERLIQPILRSIEYKLPYVNLSKGVAAACHYFNVNDLESVKLTSLIKKNGIENTLINICDSKLISEAIFCIRQSYNKILKEIM